MTVSDTIDIAAPPDVVWRITTDVESWPDWTPTVADVRLLTAGPLRLGSVAAIKQPLQPRSRWTVVEYDTGRMFAWRSERFGLRMTGVHELSGDAPGTRNRLAVEATGFLAALLWPLLRPTVRKALRAENAGLKRRCESEHEGRKDNKILEP